MGKLKSLFIAAAALSCPFLACSGAAGQAMQTAAYFAAGITVRESSAQPAEISETTSDDDIPADTYAEPAPESSAPAEQTSAVSAAGENTSVPEEETSDIAEEAADATGELRPISQNMTYYSEPAAEYPEHSGAVVRRQYGSSLGTDHITLQSGAQVRNCTTVSNETLTAAASEYPALEADLSEPAVLIVHTHTTECFQPAADDWYDAARPTRSRDCTKNMVAVGNALADALAENGVIAVHDGTVHDYPAYTGAYDRSEETIIPGAFAPRVAEAVANAVAKAARETGVARL